MSFFLLPMYFALSWFVLSFVYLTSRFSFYFIFLHSHNDLPWNIRKFVRNRLKELRFDEDLTRIEPWSESNWSHTDLPRLRAGQIGAQVNFDAPTHKSINQYKDNKSFCLLILNLGNENNNTDAIKIHYIYNRIQCLN